MSLLGNYRCSVKKSFVLFWINAFCFLQCEGGANKKICYYRTKPPASKAMLLGMQEALSYEI